MGEGGWGALEIIIVLILVLALLGRFFGTGIGSKKVPDIATYTSEEIATTAPAFNDCGKLLIQNPKPSQKIALTVSGIQVQGSLKSCDLIAVAPSTFSVVVVDAYATVISEVSVTPIVVSQDTVSFNTYIPFGVSPRTGTGYVIVTRISNTGTQVSEGGARIPVRFVN
ncbi:hypothetical protein K2Q02_02325 [Patescibacteria group bacterium]|nr:hypothetical protein [Patescibacteria group bacterium]